MTAVGATHRLLLHAADLHASAVDLVERLQPADAELEAFDNTDARGEQIRTAVERFTADVPPERVVIDVKSATAKMKYWVGRAAQKGNWMLNLAGEDACRPA